MSQAAEKLLTFNEFTALSGDGRFELVNGRLEELVAPLPLHGWTSGKIFSVLDEFLEAREPGAYWGVEVDIPTIPFHGRRPDFLYYSASDAAKGLDLSSNRVAGVPTLVVEVLSEADRSRDTITKRDEYARAGIAHYWILDPDRRCALTLALSDRGYEPVGEFTENDILTSDLFPGLEIRVSRLFR